MVLKPQRHDFVHDMAVLITQNLIKKMTRVLYRVEKSHDYSMIR